MKPTPAFSFPYARTLFTSLLISSALSGCATYPDWLASSGPSRQQVLESGDSQRIEGIQVVDIDDTVARKLLTDQKKALFSEAFSSSAKQGYVIGAGDVIEVSIWEAPPALLFGGTTIDPRMGPATTRVTTFPEQMVSSQGTINIPFAGQIASANKTPQQIEAEIAQRLKSKANQPQVLVRIIRNNTANVTVVGEVGSSTRMPLTARGERLLDALAAAGGVRQSVNKMTLQVTRGYKVQALPLDTIIRDPKQNIVLQPGDVVTALFQPLSFTVLGATGKNEEINFEAQGISLAQALARAGGLQDTRSDARAVFIFRLEDSNALNWKTTPKTTPDGKVPVVYQLNLKDPASFFIAQSFPIDNKDVLYVSNAPSADLQKFLNIVVSVVYPIVNVGTIKF
ncbi:MAG: polysaccharide biosynthesis/export family protein [Sulfuriferula sp.]